MKRMFKLLLFLVFIIPVSANAAEVSVDCPDIVKAGDDVTCKINISSIDKFVGFQADVSASSGLTYKLYDKTSGWGGTSSATKFLLYDNEVEGNVLLGSYTYSVAANASGNLNFTLNNIVVSDPNADPIAVNTSASDTIRVLSGVNTLSSLTASGATFTFSPDTTTYNLTINSEKTTISATATDSKSTITGVGEKNLNIGNNKFDIVVMSESGSKKTYTLNITRNDTRSSDNKLKSLSVSEGKIDFSSDKTEYKIILSEDIKEITFSAEASDSKAKVEGIGTKKLELGKNNFVIKVTSENENVREYRIIVVRGTEEVVNVPNTSKKIPLIISIFGIMFVSIGSFVIYRTKHN